MNIAAYDTNEMSIIEQSAIRAALALEDIASYLKDIMINTGRIHDVLRDKAFYNEG